MLAAGGSRRLGRPKQLLRRDGEALVRRAVRLAAATRPVRLLLVLGAQRESIAAAVASVDAEHLDNPDWELGLAGSLRVAAHALAAHAGTTLIIGCDQPALELAHLQHLLDGAVAAGAGCAATVFAGGRLGLPAVVPATLLREAPALRGDRGFGDALSRSVQSWRLEAPELQLDVDVAADVDLAIARGWLDREP